MKNSNIFLPIIIIFFMLSMGCNTNYLIYIYDTQENKITGVRKYEYNKPGFLAGNVENISFCSSDTPYFITTQIFDRQNVGFIIAKRNFDGTVIENKTVLLGENIDYSLSGGFSVNANMTKGIILSLPKQSKFIEKIDAFVPTGEVDLLLYDFTKNIQETITSIDSETGYSFEWIDKDNILLCTNRFKSNQSVMIIDVSDSKNIEKIELLTGSLDFYLSSDHKKIFYHSFENPELNILCYYDIKEKKYYKNKIFDNDEINQLSEIKYRFEYENHVYLIDHDKVFAIDIGTEKHYIANKSILPNGFEIKSGIAGDSGILFFGIQKKDGTDDTSKICIFIPNKASDKIQNIIAIENIFFDKIKIGYHGRYLLLQR